MTPEQIYADLFHVGRKPDESSDDYQARLNLQEYVLKKMPEKGKYQFNKTFKTNLKKLPHMR
jgi:hypothetical protein